MLVQFRDFQRFLGCNLLGLWKIPRDQIFLDLFKKWTRFDWKWPLWESFYFAVLLHPIIIAKQIIKIVFESKIPNGILWLTFSQISFDFPHLGIDFALDLLKKLIT